MSCYSQTIFPALCDFLLRQPFLARYRQEILSKVAGDILEIGFGTGLNLPHYPPHVRTITAVDPNQGMQRKAELRVQCSAMAVKHHLLTCECLPFADNTFDSVVSTWTLCSIADINQAVREVYRVLKPGGRFHFLEHGLAPEPSVQKWQRRLNWLEMRLGGGCRLDRNIRELVAIQPFATLTADEFYLAKFPKTHSYMYRGIATK